MTKHHHVLVIGGTGMLSEFVRSIARNTDNLTLLARDKEKLSIFRRELANHCKVNTISTDYYDIEDLFLSVTEAIKEMGRIDLVVGWVHSPAVQATPIIATAIANSSPEPVRYFDVRGSSIALPNFKDSRQEQISFFENIDYRRVVLGFKKLNGRSVWLTHEEISEGVSMAIALDATEHVVGKISPIEEIPGFSESILSNFN